MRRWSASLAVLGVATAAVTAQTIPVPGVGGCGQTQSIFFDDGTSETSWKVNNPTAALDAFNLDFDTTGANFNVTGVALSVYQSISTGIIGLKYIALCPDNLAVNPSGTTPNLAIPFSILGNLSGTVPITGVPGTAAGYCESGVPYTGSNTTGFTGYDLPDFTLNSTLGAHVVATQLTGDSGLWLCSDQSSVQGRTGFTLNNYSTPAVALSGNIQFRLIVDFTNPNGSAYMTINNLVDNVGLKQLSTVAATLWSSATVQPTLYIQGAFITGFPFIPAPQFVLSTGFENFLPIADNTQGTLCGPIGPPCLPLGTQFDFGAFFIDNNNLKKNGNGKIALTNLVSCTIVGFPSGSCGPPQCYCFGESDDGNMDGSAWKVQNPAGSKDYYNVRVGDNTPGSGLNCVKTLTSIEAASWDFCGSGPSWASFGVYPANMVLDSSGGTPDLANPIALASTLSMPAGSANFAYPAVIYDFPDTNSSTNVTLAGANDVHLAAQWATGDTCTWIGSDADGIDDNSSSTDCAQIPTRKSYYTLDGYSTPSYLNSFANMMMKVNWF